MKEYSEEIQSSLKSLVETFDKEDRPVRERQIRTWRRLKFYWDGLLHYYDSVAHDWRTWDLQNYSSSPSDQGYYDKPINVFKAYLESIIAALSVIVPPIYCSPDDADNPLDLQTAKAGDKIAELIRKHNNAQLLWIHALFIYATEGLIAAYNYTREDKKYGTVPIPKYENGEETKDVKICPACQYNYSEEEEINAQLEGDIETNDGCPQCGELVAPIIEPQTFRVSRLVGTTDQPKSRQCIEVYGGLFVKVPVWARKQEDIPYLIFSYETDYANALELYPQIKSSLKRQGKNIDTGAFDNYEAWARMSTQYRGTNPIDVVTIRQCWLRPSAYNRLDEKCEEEIRKEFPDGCKVTFVNDQFADACEELLDDHWTLTHNPLSDYLHHDPLGQSLTSVQDITNDLVSLVLQTIEHGIPQTFASPDILDFKAYEQTEATPGGIFPTKTLGSKKIGDGFYEVKTATLSGEVLPFSQSVQEMGQLVSGALPSLFGGAQPNSSKTAAQYSMSKNQAMQRLQTPWKMLSLWWKDIFGKVIPAYINDVIDDEKFVQKTENGNFINVFIRKAELQGHIGSVELESSEQLPETWQQKKDAIMQFFQAANPEIMAALTSPENIPFIKSAIGLDEFIMPGEDDRMKQFEEIQVLADSTPVAPMIDPQIEMAAQSGDPMAQQMLMQSPQEMPSVEIEPDVDNHQIHANICRAWLISEAGRLAKIENPSGYRNVLLHMKQHQMIIAQSIAAQQQAQQVNSGQPQAAAPTENSNEAMV